MPRRVTSTSGSSGMASLCENGFRPHWSPDVPKPPPASLLAPRAGSAARGTGLCCVAAAGHGPAWRRANGGRAGRDAGSQLGARRAVALPVADGRDRAAPAATPARPTSGSSTPRAARATKRCSGAPSTLPCRPAPANRRWPPRAPGGWPCPSRWTPCACSCRSCCCSTAATRSPSRCRPCWRSRPQADRAGPDRRAAAFPATRQRPAPARRRAGRRARALPQRRPPRACPCAWPWAAPGSRRANPTAPGRWRRKPTPLDPRRPARPCWRWN